MSDKQYWVGNDEENFTEGPFETVAEALQEGLDYYEIEEDGGLIYVGEQRPIEISISGDWIINRLQEYAYEQVGEWADGWPDLCQQEVNELESLVDKTIIEYLKRQNMMPSFFRVVNSKSYDAESAKKRIAEDDSNVRAELPGK